MRSSIQCPHCTLLWPSGSSTQQSTNTATTTTASYSSSQYPISAAAAPHPSAPVAEQCAACDAPRCLTCSYINPPSILAQLTAGNGGSSGGVLVPDHCHLLSCEMCNSPLLLRRRGLGSVGGGANNSVNGGTPLPHPQVQTTTPFGPSPHPSSSRPHEAVATNPSRHQPPTQQQQEHQQQQSHHELHAPTATRRKTLTAMAALVEQTRRQCREAGTIFVDTVDILNNTNYSSGSNSTSYPMALASLPPPAADSPTVLDGARQATLLPSTQRPHASAADAIAAAFSSLFAKQNNVNHHHDGGWHIIDPHVGISALDIEQGAIGDCWFLSAVAVLAHRHPQLVQSLFVTPQMNPEGVIAVRLWHNGAWRCYRISATFPSTHGGRALAYGRTRSGTALWVSALEKALAVSRGGYANVCGGKPRDALIALTGMPVLSYKCKPNNDGGGGGPQRDGRDDDFEDDDDGHVDPFSRLASYADAECIMCATCGGTAEADAAADSIGLESNHAYSVLGIMVHPATRQRIVALRNPWGHTKYKGLQVPPSPGVSLDVDPTRGAFWMLYDLFLRCFTEIDVALTRNYQTVVNMCDLVISPHGVPAPQQIPPTPPPPSASKQQAITWTGEFSLPQDTILGRLAFTTQTSCEVHFLVAQHVADVKARKEYRDVTILLLQLTNNNNSGGRTATASSTSSVWTLRSVSKCRCDAVQHVSAMLQPGVYCMVPVSVNGGVVSCTLLSEVASVCMMTGGDEGLPSVTSGGGVLPDLPPLSQLLFELMRYQSTSSSSSYSNRPSRSLVEVGTQLICGVVKVATVTIGNMYVLIVQHLDDSVVGGVALRNVSSGGGGAIVDATIEVNSQGLVVCTNVTGLTPKSDQQSGRGDGNVISLSQIRLTKGRSAIVAIAAPTPHDGSYALRFAYKAQVQLRTAPSPVAAMGNVLQEFFSRGGGGDNDRTSERSSIFTSFATPTY